MTMVALKAIAATVTTTAVARTKLSAESTAWMMLCTLATLHARSVKGRGARVSSEIFRCDQVEIAHRRVSLLLEDAERTHALCMHA